MGGEGRDALRGVLKFFIPILVVLPGLIALRLVPDLEDADKAYAQLMTILLPAGLRGLVFAAFLAAMMSSVDSILASAATLVTRDCLMAWSHLAPSPRRLLAIGRAVTVLLLVGGIGLAATMETELFAGIYEILQSSLAIIKAPRGRSSSWGCSGGGRRPWAGSRVSSPGSRSRSD